MELQTLITTNEQACRPQATDTWQSQLANAVRDPDELLEILQLDPALRDAARSVSRSFPLLAPRRFVDLMEPGNATDPLLLQVLPLGLEALPDSNSNSDAVGDQAARRAPGLLHKYDGRALLITTGACAIHCRYCFRREYPYADEPRRLADWQPALDVLRQDSTIHEVILSGGDPLMLTDHRLQELVELIVEIPHVQRLRLHTRLPIVLPDRVTPKFVGLLQSIRQAVIIVVHANHPREIAADCAATLRHLVRSGFTVLNQAVLLRGINDDEHALTELCERLIDLGVIPYYLSQLDRVTGTTHFEVSEARGRELIAHVRTRLPGYAVPQYVREISGERHKMPIVS